MQPLLIDLICWRSRVRAPAGGPVKASFLPGSWSLWLNRGRPAACRTCEAGAAEAFAVQVVGSVLALSRGRRLFPIICPTLTTLPQPVGPSCQHYPRLTTHTIQEALITCNVRYLSSTFTCGSCGCRWQCRMPSCASAVLAHTP